MSIIDKLSDYGEEAYNMMQNGHTYAEIGARFGVSQQAAHKAVQNYTKYHDRGWLERQLFKVVENPELNAWLVLNCESLEAFADMLQVKKHELYRYFRTKTKTLTIPLKIQEITGLPLDDIIIRKDKKQ